MLLMASCFVAARTLSDHGDMHVVMLGDSNTWLGGDGCDCPRGWNKWFRDFFAPATCRSYARSGATWTNTERTVRDVEECTDRLGDNNVIYNQINRLVADVAEGRQPAPGLILIAAGTNDVWFAKSRPAAFTMTADEAFGAVYAGAEDVITGRVACEILTLAESVRYGCEMLRAAFPDAHIVLLTPLQTTAVSVEAVRRTGDIIEGCGRRMGLGVIRQDGDGFVSREQELRQKRMTTDGTHTSEAGARNNGARIARLVSGMIGGKAVGMPAARHNGIGHSPVSCSQRQMSNARR